MIDLVVEMMGVLTSTGSVLREQVHTAQAHGPGWTVFVGDARRIDLARAPLEIVLGVLDGAPGKPLAVALPMETLSRSLGRLGDQRAHDAEVAPDVDDCACVVATMRGLLSIRLPNEGAESRVIAAPCMHVE